MNKSIGLIGLVLLVFGGMFTVFALNPMPCDYALNPYCFERVPSVMSIFITGLMFLVGLILAVVSLVLPPDKYKDAIEIESERERSINVGKKQNDGHAWQGLRHSSSASLSFTSSTPMHRKRNLLLRISLTRPSISAVVGVRQPVRPMRPMWL